MRFASFSVIKSVSGLQFFIRDEGVSTFTRVRVIGLSIYNFPCVAEPVKMKYGNVP